MTAFPGQLTTHSLNACQTFVWTLAPFYLKLKFKLKVLQSKVFPVYNA